MEPSHSARIARELDPSLGRSGLLRCLWPPLTDRARTTFGASVLAHWWLRCADQAETRHQRGEISYELTQFDDRSCCFCRSPDQAALQRRAVLGSE